MTLVQLLLEDIPSDKTRLIVVGENAWPYVQKLTPTEKDWAANMLGVQGGSQSQLAKERTYNLLCNFLHEYEEADNLEQLPPHRFYWIHAAQLDRLVGVLTVSAPPQSHDALAIGFSLIKDFCGRGFALSAVNSLADYVFSNHISPYICGETKLDNEKAVSLLRYAHFVEVAQGLCTTSLIRGVPVRRFIRAETIPTEWPIAAL